MQLRFGEYAKNLPEASPGYLDKVERPAVWLVGRGAERTIALQRKTRGLALQSLGTQWAAVLVEDRDYPLLTSAQGSKRWLPAARYLSDAGKAGKPRLTLDVVPTGKLGEFQVTFRGKPLPRAEVQATAQSGWSVSRYSSKKGIVEFSFPWKGSYLVHLRHTEEAPGSRVRRGVKEEFSSQSFSTTVAFELQRGLAGPPRPPLLPPNVLSPSGPPKKLRALDHEGEGQK